MRNTFEKCIWKKVPKFPFSLRVDFHSTPKPISMKGSGISGGAIAGIPRHISQRNTNIFRAVESWIYFSLPSGGKFRKSHLMQRRDKIYLSWTLFGRLVLMKYVSSSNFERIRKAPDSFWFSMPRWNAIILLLIIKGRRWKYSFWLSSIFENLKTFFIFHKSEMLFTKSEQKIWLNLLAPPLRYSNRYYCYFC